MPHPRPRSRPLTILLLPLLFLLVLPPIAALALDSDGDGVEDGVDDCAFGTPGVAGAAANADFDGDGCDDLTEDLDVDGDGVTDIETFYLCTLMIREDSQVSNSAGKTDTVYGQGINYKVHHAWQADGSDIRRAYIRVVLADAGEPADLCVETGVALPRYIPVDSATLELKAITADPNLYQVSRASVAWDETTLTWNNQPGAAAPVTAGGPAVKPWTSWDVSSDMNLFTSAAAGNHGWRIHRDDETYDAASGGALFVSSEHSDGQFHPYVIVGYSVGDPLGTDACSHDPLGHLADTDGDGLCDDGGDLDDDGDGVVDDDDAFPLDADETSDADGDGVGDNQDDDDDNDGVGDLTDLCPLGVMGSGSGPANADRDHDGCDDLAEDSDDDGDGIPDGSDTDSDNDGVADGMDACPLGLIGSGAGAANVDADGDGCDDLAEDTDDDGDGSPDDTVYKNCTLLFDRDSWVNQASGDTVYGNGDTFTVGPELSEDGGDRRRSLLAVDLSSDCTETGAPLPKGVALQSAYLRLYTNNGPNVEQLHDITRVVDFGAWTEATLSWNNQPTVAAAATASVIVSHKNRWLVEWDVVEDIERFRAGTLNNGWRVSVASESYHPDGRRGDYLSREFNGHTDSALAHPRLQIRYRTSVRRQSISDVAVLLLNPTLDRFTISGQCAAGVDVYQMPWGRNKLLVGKDLVGQISRRDISDSLLFLDHADERFAELFGYAYTQDVPAREPEVRVCHEIGNAGTDNQGIGMPATSYIGSSFTDGREARAGVLTLLVHERIHTWQHRRGNLFMPAGDGGHAQLVGLEPGLYQLAHQGFLNERPMPPELLHFAIYHAALERYFADPARGWDTFFSPAALAAYQAGTAPITDDADRQLIYSGIFEWIRQVHGEAGLAAFHTEAEALRIASGWDDLSNLPDRTAKQRNDFFLEALIAGLGVDAADYFAHWKMPISAALQTYSDGFPVAPGTLDLDGDTFTPLEGDFDDGDASIYPRAPELTDGKDNNSDGQVDETVLEETGGDLSAIPSDTIVALPLTLFGEVDTLTDIDGLQFDLPSRSLVTVILRAVDSDSTVADTGSFKQVSTFVGRVQLDGAKVGRPDIFQLQYATLSQVLGAGSHELTISASADGSVPANPGEYVLQVFADDFASPGMAGVEGAADFDYRLANRLTPDPVYSCDDARNASPAECQVLSDAYDYLGGEHWLDIRGWLDTDDVCSFKGVRCDEAGVDRLLLDSDEGRAPVGTLGRFDWSAFSTSLSTLELDGSAVGGALPTEFGTLALEVFRFDPAGQLCVPTALRTWFEAIPAKSGDLLDCCVADGDGDGDVTCNDNCPLVANPGQEDGDTDGLGDACDACPMDAANDSDDDGFCAQADNCPLIFNPSQTDSDGDGAGNACDTCALDPLDDGDGDGFCANVDNCPTTANPDQADGDLDMIGDLCDACPNDPFNDSDGDGFCADVDNCAGDFNPSQDDADQDGFGDVCDLCEGNDATGDADFDGVCFDRDCDDNDGAGISCGLFFDSFETGDTHSWSASTP